MLFRSLDAPKLSIMGTENIRILAQGDGPEYLHRVEVVGAAVDRPTPTSPITPTRTATLSPTPSATRTPTRTATLSRTATPTRTATPSPFAPYPTYTPYPTLTSAPTWTPVPSPTQMTSNDLIEAAKRQLEYLNPGYDVVIEPRFIPR